MLLSPFLAFFNKFTKYITSICRTLKTLNINEDRIIELLSESLQKQDEMVSELSGIRKEAEYIKEQQAKSNLEVKEVRLSVMKLAEYIERLLKFEERIEALEKAVFK
jgi:hypothetical protein